MCLNMLRHATCPMYLVALEGSREESLARWPLLREFADRLHFLNKTDGFCGQSVRQLRRIIRQHRAQAIHTHHIGPLLYGKLAILGLACRHVHTEHDAWHLEDPKQCWLTRLLMSKQIRLVADAPTVADDLAKKLHTVAPLVILNGIDTQQFIPGDQAAARQQLNLPPDAFLIGCAGRLVPEKALETLLEILPTLPSSMHVAVAGDGEMRQRWQQLARQLGVAERITWLGYVNNMHRFYQAIDLFCMPSVKEGLPLALLEAQACGCSVVASRVGAIPELTNPATGALFTPEDRRSLASILRRKLTADHHHNRTLNQQYVARIADIRTTVARYQQLACQC
ncbi:glycosyltransferase [Photobacterium atrarenae]|uniref:Glycosyltransferase n=1 Tax=Photobacterium atrarenae TaxID=865757 RepID=A0ABY5GKJ4_9GAMM|nr:glycosyltransferase [Photobacterium atrarenae]UTV29291.1 glycosyltransferase [Photobacterium atrarenae]